MKYPAAKKADVVDDYHGTKIADPYRWLEDTDSPETAAVGRGGESPSRARTSRPSRSGRGTRTG